MTHSIQDRLTEPARDDATPTEEAGVAFVVAYTCAGIERIGREAGFPIAVIAATRDPGGHADRLGATRHAAWVARDGGGVSPFLADAPAAEREFEYAQLLFERDWIDESALPAGVAFRRGALAVTLPHGASADDLSALLLSGLADLAFDDVARQPDRVRHRFATHRSIVVPPRYALAEPDDPGSLVPVENIFLFEPADLPRLACTVALAVGSLGLACRLDCPCMPGSGEAADA